MKKLLVIAQLLLLLALPVGAIADDPPSGSTLDIGGETPPFVPLTAEQLAPMIAQAKEWENSNQCSCNQDATAAAACETGNCMYELELWCKARKGTKWTNKKVQSLYFYCVACQSAPTIPDIVAQYWVQATIDASSGANKGWYKDCYLDWKYVGPCGCRDF